MTRNNLRVWVAAALFLWVAAHAQADDATLVTALTERSAAGHYQLQVTSRSQPIEINRMHAWLLRLTDGEGRPVANAEITVDGGMPDHDHGLPTRPQVTRDLGNGNYLLEGMKFHMPGAWEVIITISASDISDTVTFRFEL